MQVAILLYDGMTALDAVGPFEVLSRIPGSTVVFVAAEPGRRSAVSETQEVKARKKK